MDIYFLPLEFSRIYHIGPVDKGNRGISAKFGGKALNFSRLMAPDLNARLAVDESRKGLSSTRKIEAAESPIAYT
jgi:hypothetical protein